MQGSQEGVHPIEMTKKDINKGSIKELKVRKVRNLHFFLPSSLSLPKIPLEFKTICKINAIMLNSIQYCFVILMIFSFAFRGDCVYGYSAFDPKRRIKSSLRFPLRRSLKIDKVFRLLSVIVAVLCTDEGKVTLYP